MPGRTVLLTRRTVLLRMQTRRTHSQLPPVPMRVRRTSCAVAMLLLQPVAARDLQLAAVCVVLMFHF